MVLLLIIVLLSFSEGHLQAAATSELRPFFRTTTLSGLTHPIKEMTISSEVSGTCQAIYGDIGDPVPLSGILAKLDSTFVELDLAANKIARDQAKRRLEQEEKTLARYTVLKNKNSTPQVTFDEVTLQVNLHKLTLQKLRNDRIQLEEKLIRHQLAGPPGWTVIKRFIEPGEYIQAATPVAHLGDFRTLLIRLTVTYEELQALKEQERITLWFPEISMELTATIYQISPIFDAKTRKIPLELMINDSLKHNSPLRGGMRAELSFPGKAETNSFLVPQSALINRYDAHWLVRPDGSQLQVLLLGKAREENQAIVSGEQLNAGMQILTNPSRAPQ